MKGNLHIKSFIILSLYFIFFTCIGTLMHEAGHYAIAGLLGLHPQLHYNFTSLQDQSLTASESYLVTAAGPLSTLFTALLGLIYLFQRVKAALPVSEWSRLHTLAFFASLFLLRFPFNALVRGITLFFHTPGDMASDEQSLALALDWPKDSISLFMALMASVVLLIIFFRFVTKQDRWMVLLSAFTGSFFGILIWMKFLGPLLLP